MKSLSNTEQPFKDSDQHIAPPSNDDYKRHSQRGRQWLGFGVCLMGLSFGVNFLLFDSGTSFITAMYILTTVGIGCILKGMAGILGF